jgi:hypothetical protein
MGRRVDITTDELRAMIGERADEIVRRFLPRARLTKKNTWEGATNPARADRHAGSFIIYGSNHPKAGGYVDYASGQTGGPLDLIALLEHRQHRPDAKFAIQLCLDFLGLKDTAADPAWLEEQKRKAKQRADDAERLAREQEKREETRMLDLWGQCKPLDGTPAQAYLEQARGCRLDALAEQPGALRFHPRLPNWKEPRAGAGFPHYPCLVAAMSRMGKGIAALQRTYLTDAGQKASVAKVKLIYPASVGAAIRIARGANRCSPEQAVARGLTGETLILCEGAEDAVTLAMAKPDARVWAVCGVNNLQHQIIPASVSRVIIAGDNDWHGSMARDALNVGVLAVKQQVRDVRVAFSEHGKDFNDWLKGDA